MGNAVPTNGLYTNVKTLLERVAPVMIDMDAMDALVAYLDDAVNGLQEINDDIPDVVEKGMGLLAVCCCGAFMFAKPDDLFIANHLCLGTQHVRLVHVHVHLMLGLFQLLSIIYPGAFQSEDIYTKLISFVKNDNDVVCKYMLP